MGARGDTPPPQLRIGFLVSGWWPEPGGVQRHTAELAQALACRGHRVSALAFGARGAEPEESQVGGTWLRRLPDDWRRLRGAADLRGRARLAREVAAWCVEQGLDLLHVHDTGGFGTGWIPSQARRLPVFWTWHDYGALCPRGQLWHVDGRACERAEPKECAGCVARTWTAVAGDEELETQLAARLEDGRRAAGACARVFAPSEAARAVFGRHGHVQEGVEWAENATAVDAVPVPRRAPDPERLVVGVLGSLQPSKGVLQLARWIAELGRPFELELHGPAGAYHGDDATLRGLRALVAEGAPLRLAGAFAPEELDDVLGRLDLVAVPSLWEEVHGLAAREARARGRAVFAARTGGLDDPGFQLLPPGDGAAWKRDLVRFAADPAWRTELEGRPTRLRDVDALADQLLAAYSEAL